MSKKILLGFFLSLLLSNLGLAQTDLDEQELKELISESFDKIFSEKQTDLMSNYYTNNFLLLEHGEVWDRQKLIEMLSLFKDDPSQRINTFDYVEIKISENTAWMVYHNTAIFKQEGKKVGEMNW